MNRREFITLVGGTTGAMTASPIPWLDWTTAAEAQEQNWHQGFSLFGDLKYPPGFNQFDYVNANSPKGGTVRQVVIGTFNNFNMVVAGVKGSLAAG